ncbi:hypothetical protein B0I37DRAFT_330891 [Chaetomium sp. MPI-CAGE-AT-0009]|nr:hypothetical protein B0I37DRAFT_330891 [Chaetomium sp. MPI-CAGE-AT-0009]
MQNQAMMGITGSTPKAAAASETDSECKLYFELEAAMVHSRDAKERFIPTGQWKPLISKEAVARELGTERRYNSQREIENIASFACSSAAQTFATLCMADAQYLFPLFHLAQFDDKKLPIEREDLIEKLKKMVEDAKATGLPLDPRFSRPSSLSFMAKSFSENQWLFAAQSFNTDTFTYGELAPETRLPFLNSDPPIYSGTFSTVCEKVLHNDHLTLSKRHKEIGFIVPRKKTDQGEEHPWLALKELKHATEEICRTTGTNMSEADILKTMNEVGHRHLLQTIAHYTLNGKEYFLFPWAERGSLRKYWQTTTPNPTPEYVIWLVGQMAGLADAVSKLHGRKCRHGDLKPDNILCFGRQGDATENTMMPPDRLVIGDLGLAKIHDFITALRKNVATDTKAGTMMYSPPEYVQGGAAPWSRLFDIWSLGCVYLEFVVWLLRGHHGLQKLSQLVAPNDSERNTFYTIIGGDGATEPQIAVHSTVKQYIDDLLSDQRCGGESTMTGLRRVIRLIADEMIVIALPPEGAASTGEMAQAREEQTGRTQDSGSSQTAQPPEIIVQAATTIGAEDKTKVRATAKRVHEVLAKIHHEMKMGITKAMEDPGPSHEPNQQLPTKPALGTPADHRTRSYLSTPSQPNVRLCRRLSTFNESWEHSPDTEIATEIFRYLESADAERNAILPAPHRRGVSPLCNRCAQLKLSGPRRSFPDTLAGLAEKKGDCALCALLHSSCVRRHEGLPETARVQFSRAGSYLAARREKGEQQLVASLCRTRFVPNSQGVQLGFPNLPATDSSLHMKLLSLWISACDRDHICSQRASDFFPTRVIDVGEPAPEQHPPDSIVRLVYQTSDIKPSNRYVALSHRWGPPPAGHHHHHHQQQPQPPQQERKARTILLSRLPRTFRDAVTVTRELGVRYLWIDSLCIVQDDPHDWHRESQMMERVYTSAYCTLAAIRAGSPEDGFLGPVGGREGERGRERDMVVVGDGGAGDEIYVCEMLDDFDEHVGRSELQRRGWVLQERALSRRTIHFTEKQTYWECGRGVRLYSEQAAFLGDSNFPRYGDARSKGKRIKLIQGLYEQYSAMQLTYAKDRPAAIRGLEARLVQTIGGPGGYGVFRRHMHRYLLWKRQGEVGLERIDNFPPDERVPSWSWMAYAGEIKYIDVPGYNVAWDENLKWPCSDSEPVPFRLEAPVRDVSRLQAEDIILDDGRPMLTQAAKCVVVGTIRVRAGMLGGNEKYCYVLIVEPVTTPDDGGSESGKVWQRLGVARLQRQHIVFEPEGQDLDLKWIV